MATLSSLPFVLDFVSCPLAMRLFPNIQRLELVSSWQQVPPVPAVCTHAHAHRHTPQMAMAYLCRGLQDKTGSIQIAKKWWYCMRTDKTTFRALRKSLAFIPSFFFQPSHVWQSANAVEVLRSGFCAHTYKVESS